jgi:hypothetical protein
MLMLLAEMRLRTLSLRETGMEPELAEEIERLGDRVQACVERYRTSALVYRLPTGRSPSR